MLGESKRTNTKPTLNSPAPKTQCITFASTRTAWSLPLKYISNATRPCNPELKGLGSSRPTPVALMSAVRPTQGAFPPMISTAFVCRIFLADRLCSISNLFSPWYERPTDNRTGGQKLMFQVNTVNMGISGSFKIRHSLDHAMVATHPWPRPPAQRTNSDQVC